MKDRIKNENFKIDKLYRLITEHRTNYSDDLLESIDFIMKMKEENKVDDNEMGLLLRLVLLKETKKEIQGLNKWVDALGESKNQYSVLFNIASKERKYT